MRREFHCPSAVGKSDWLRDESGLTIFTNNCWALADRKLRNTPVAELDVLAATADEHDCKTAGPLVSTHRWTARDQR